MIYILDAYNVIHKIKRLDAALDKDLRTAREALMTFCRELMDRRGDITKMILVFDGKSEFNDLSHPAPRGLQLVFSETGEDADERIIIVLEELGNEKKCVISDDNFVRNTARSHQTASMSVAEFEAFERSVMHKNSKPSGPKGFKLSPEEAADITEEYRRQLGL